MKVITRHMCTQRAHDSAKPSLTSMSTYTKADISLTCVSTEAEFHPFKSISAIRPMTLKLQPGLYSLVLCEDLVKISALCGKLPLTFDPYLYINLQFIKSVYY